MRRAGTQGGRRRSPLRRNTTMNKARVILPAIAFASLLVTPRLFVPDASAQTTAAAQTTLTLSDFEKQVLDASPLVRQADQQIAAAQGRARQAGMYPNPMIGSSGEHISNAPELRGGTIGGYVEQRFVTA